MLRLLLVCVSALIDSDITVIDKKVELEPSSLRESEGPSDWKHATAQGFAAGIGPFVGELAASGGEMDGALAGFAGGAGTGVVQGLGYNYWSKDKNGVWQTPTMGAVTGGFGGTLTALAAGDDPVMAGGIAAVASGASTFGADYLYTHQSVFDALKTEESQGTGNGVPKANETGVPKANETGVPKDNETGVPKANETGVPQGTGNGVPKANETGVPQGTGNGVPKKGTEES